jgi:zinc/manganese transport system permease protein
MNPFTGLVHLLDHEFLRHALVAGTAIALAAGCTGYFLVLRSQVFTADALSHVAFTGALIALIFGFDPRVGLFAATIAISLFLGAIGPRSRPDDVTIGAVFAWILGIGVLALSIFTTHHSASHGNAGTNILFGSLYGLDTAATRDAVIVAAVVVLVTLAIGRPLLFASIDESVAAARGVPVRLLGYVFLALVGAMTAQATQAVGALLVLGLLAGPAAIAIQLTTRPYRAIVIAMAIAAAMLWAGICLSYAAPRLPPSFSVIAIITASYAITTLSRRRFPVRLRRG